MTDFISRLKSRDQNAFTELYANYSETLFFKISQMTGDKLCAEDILQDAFVKVWNGIDSFDHTKASIYTWMIRICRNEVVDYFRVQNSSKRTMTSSYVRNTDIHYISTPGNKLDAKRFLSTLEHKDRHMLDLIYFHGYSYSQTSEIMDMPIGSLKSRVRKVLSKWRPVLC